MRNTWDDFYYGRAPGASFAPDGLHRGCRDSQCCSSKIGSDGAQTDRGSEPQRPEEGHYVHRYHTMEEIDSGRRSLDLDPSSLKELRCSSSASLDMDWEKFTASVDVLEGCRATTMPAEASRPVLNSICTDNTTRNLPQDIAVRSRSADRLQINLAEYRKGYHYTVEVLRPAPDQENMTPRRVLDQQGSNDFAAYLQETAGSPMLSPDLYLASSPFAAHTRQPFDDRASCRSRLSDYGYDTQSEDGDYGDEEGRGYDGAAPDQDAQGTKRPAEPFEDCGFWAEVGASESQESPANSQGTSTETHFEFAPPGPVKWEVNEWDSASDRGKRHCAPSATRKELFPSLAADRASDGVPSFSGSPDPAAERASGGSLFPGAPDLAAEHVSGGVAFFPDVPDLANLDRLRSPGPPPAVLLPWDME
ncbi:hypothetical protein WJX75_000866 [Coccomyxa subellipsoidea]|uniref:Uncharacterized protein n=1 Tax=Coccomyxa subellipsoidea TaxID=248742 RepID=A0ABR2YSI3_9CHLO